MQRLIVTITLAILLSVAGTPSVAQSQNIPGYIISIEGTFDDVYDELKSAIIDEGLTIDYVGNVDQMLERTSQVNISEGSKPITPIYQFAKYMQFCSSALTHKAVQANPQNLSMCPFLVFIYQTVANPGHVVIGYRPPTLSADQESIVIARKVNSFLKGILNEVASNY